MIQWAKLAATLFPIHDFEDLSRRWQEAFAYEFVRGHYNYAMLEMAGYTGRMLGEDIRQRYDAWCQTLVGLFKRLDELGVKDIRDLIAQAGTRELFEGFVERTGMPPEDLLNGMKYLVYWFIPMKKPLGQLIRNDPRLLETIAQLRQAGMRCNLDLIENGLTPQACRELAQRAGAPEAEVMELVNRADFSRMPWASAATISNILGAGYGSIAKLAAANLDQVTADFFRYGESIHKNLKFGNEIESSHRIAKMIPYVLSGW